MKILVLVLLVTCALPAQVYVSCAACRTIVLESDKVTSYPVDGPELWAQARHQGLLLTTLRN